MRKFRSVSGPSRRWSQNRFAAELARGGPAVISLSQCWHCGIDLLRLSLAISLNSDTNIRLPELDFALAMTAVAISHESPGERRAVAVNSAVKYACSNPRPR